MRLCSILVFAVLVILTGCTKDQTSDTAEYENKLKDFLRDASETGDYKYYIIPDENDLNAIPQDPKNKLTREKVDLGKLIFFDTGLAMDAAKPSGMGTYSCATCHIPSAGFRPGVAQGVADGGQGFGFNGDTRVKNTEYNDDELDVQSARPLSLVNVAYVTNTFWNGQFGATEVNKETEHLWDLREDTENNFLGFEGIEAQNIQGLKDHRITINKDLLDQYGYTPMFDAAFPGVAPTERYTRLYASLAVSAYIRTILSNKAPFQEWLGGNKQAMSLDEIKGGILFFGKARCSNCHFRPNLGSLEFHALGVKDMYQSPSFNAAESDRRNLGRGGFTQNAEDNYQFKVPGLYNLSDAPFFFHGSSKTTLEEVIEYKEQARTENLNIPQDQLSIKFRPLDMTNKEREQLISFLEVSLRDPNLERYAPESVPSGFCFPNNDRQSQIDLGCQ